MFPIRDSVSRTHEPIVVWTIMGLNIAAFFYQLGLSEEELQYFLYQHALVPRRYFSPGWGDMYGLSPTDFSPLLSNIFLHGGWLHIILNLWTLYIFGPSLEDRLGRLRFAILYLLAGVAASITHAIFNAASMIPALGASGAIAGVIAAYAVRFPYAWVRVHTVVLQHSRDRLRRHLVLHAIAAGCERAHVTFPTGRRYRLVGPHRRVHRRLAVAGRPRPVGAPRRAARLVQRRAMGALGAPLA